MLLGFLPQLLLWKKILVRLIKNVDKTWLYTSVSRCARQICFQNINTFFNGININDSSWSAFTIVKTQQDSNNNSFLF